MTLMAGSNALYIQKAGYGYATDACHTTDPLHPGIGRG
jgi:hypothetical protein